MDIEAQIKSTIGGNANVSALIDNRLYPTHAPQGVSLPYAVYHIINENDKQCISGDIFQSDVRVQIDVYAPTYGSVISVKNAVKNALVGFNSSSNINSFDGYDDYTEYFKKIIDFKIKN